MILADSCCHHRHNRPHNEYKFGFPPGCIHHNYMALDYLQWTNRNTQLDKSNRMQSCQGNRNLPDIPSVPTLNQDTCDLKSDNTNLQICVHVPIYLEGMINIQLIHCQNMCPQGMQQVWLCLQGRIDRWDTGDTDDPPGHCTLPLCMSLQWQHQDRLHPLGIVNIEQSQVEHMFLRKQEKIFDVVNTVYIHTLIQHTLQFFLTKITGQWDLGRITAGVALRAHCTFCIITLQGISAWLTCNSPMTWISTGIP